jgi:hypothetical protein
MWRAVRSQNLLDLHLMVDIRNSDLKQQCTMSRLIPESLTHLTDNPFLSSNTLVGEESMLQRQLLILSILAAKSSSGTSNVRLEMALTVLLSLT